MTENLSASEKEYRKMTGTPIPKLILSLSVPTVIAMMVTAVYNVADTYFVSQLGTSASGATGIVFSLMAIIQAVGFTFGMGSGSIISRLLGQKKVRESGIVGTSAFFASVAFGVLLGVGGIAFLSPFMRLLGAKGEILPLAEEYAFFILMASPVMASSFVLNNLLRSEGKAQLALIGIGFGGILNIALDPLFIFTFDMGIRGAAVATAISQTVSFSILLFNFIRRRTTVSLRFCFISRRAGTYAAILKNGMPSFCRQGIASIATVMLNRAAAGFGDAAVAAMSIVSKIIMMVFSVLIGFGQGYQPVCGYNYSSRHYLRVKSAYRFMLWVGVAMMAVLGCGVFILAPGLMTEFINDDPAVVEIGALALRMQCVSLPFIAVGVACNMTFQSVGKAGMATFTSSFRQGFFFVPLIVILPRVLGLTGVQLTQPIADFLTCFVSIPLITGFLRSLPDSDE